MRVIIAGSRYFDDYKKMERLVLSVIGGMDDIEVVSGCCCGADRLGEKLAQMYGWSVKRFPANWKLGKVAGLIRNAEMAKYADMCILFPVQGAKNSGTRDMYRKAVREGCKVYVARL